jgi:hypothetical protein
MKTIPIALAAAITLIAATSATADGVRRTWRGPAYAAGGISHNLITPYYVGYYPARYHHYRPDPIPSGNVYRYPRPYRDGCWLLYEGELWWGC